MTDRRHTSELLRALAPALAVLLLLLAFPALSSPATAQEADTPAPDFSNVTTKAAARKLVREGRLVKILYFPAELGGPDEPQNVGYITPEAAAARDAVIDRLGHLVEDGTVDQMRVVPDYKGDSVVPSRITFTARHGDHDGSIELAIEVW